MSKAMLRSWCATAAHDSCLVRVCGTKRRQTSRPSQKLQAQHPIHDVCRVHGTIPQGRVEASTGVGKGRIDVEDDALHKWIEAFDAHHPGVDLGGFVQCSSHRGPSRRMRGWSHPGRGVHRKTGARLAAGTRLWRHSYGTHATSPKTGGVPGRQRKATYPAGRAVDSGDPTCE